MAALFHPTSSAVLLLHERIKTRSTRARWSLWRCNNGGRLLSPTSHAATVLLSRHATTRHSLTNHGRVCVNYCP
jgi:hypothetical protein